MRRSSRGSARRARRRPTAIVGVCDEVAIGTIIAARRLGIQVPSSFSVVGIDALLGNRVSILLDGREQAISDDRFLAEWTTMLTCRIEKAIAGT